MLSFYALPSTIIGNKTYPTLFAAYAFYNVANTVRLVQKKSKQQHFEKKICLPTLFAAFAFYKVANTVRLFKKIKKKSTIYSTPFLAYAFYSVANTLHNNISLYKCDRKYTMQTHAIAVYLTCI